MARSKSPAAIAKALMAAKVAGERKTARAAAKAETAARLAREKEEREAAKFEKKRPTCAECGGRESMPVGGEVIYPHREDLWGLRFWLCPCGARCECHKNTKDQPKGRPAHHSTREARIRAHAAFDPIWKAVSTRDGVDMTTARRRGYQWLGREMGLSGEEMHIGYLNEADCNRVIALCDGIREAARRRASGELL